tara:strand:+ start:1501 stop:1704 length:204 start_codon:yes stop_codon:yes gene_type:complete
MNVLKKIKLIREKINGLNNLNQELIETNLANKNKINSLEKKIKLLKNGIKETADDIEQIIEDSNAKT